MLQTVIFSKDRACQLHALLETWHLFVHGPAPIVLYHYSGPGFAAGYEMCRRRFPWAIWRHKREAAEARADTLAAIEPAVPFTMFAVDDQLFRRPCRLADAWTVLQRRPDVLSASLRLSPAIRRCFSMDRPSPPPPLEPAHVLDLAALTWTWRRQPGDWGYPMSIDTTVFRTRELRPLLERLPWETPNQLEAAMARRPLAHPRMACFQEHATLNVPANLVQRDFPGNRTSAGPTAAELNGAYLGGRVIDTAPLVSLENDSCHFPAPYRLIPYP